MKPNLKSPTILTSLMTLTILLVAYPAFSWDLTGTWCVSKSVVQSDGQNGTPIVNVIYEDTYPIVIENQLVLAYGTLFYGYVDVGGGETNGFSGAIEGKSITMTNWESVTYGKLEVKGNYPLEIHFSNNTFDASHKVGKMAVGIAVKGDCH